MNQSTEKIKADLKALIEAMKDPRVSLKELRQMVAKQEAGK